MLSRFAAWMLVVAVASPVMAAPSKQQKVEAPAAIATPTYTGAPITLTAKDLDLSQFLKALAEASKRNIVADDNVGGKVTARFRNVPWDEALDAVLRMKGLARQDVGSVIRIALPKVLEDEAKAAAQTFDIGCFRPRLPVRLIPVNYASADALAPQVRELLTPNRGTLTVDARTNVLIVKDTREVLAKAELLVSNLDVPAPQISIDARVVEATPSTIHALGIQWCEGTKGATSTIEPNGGAVGPCIGGVEETANIAPGLFSASAIPTGVHRHLVFGTVGEGSTIHHRLSEAEARGSLRILSSPKGVVRAETAMSFTGEPLPQFAGISPARSDVIVEPRFGIRATPHFTGDGAILLKVETHVSREVAQSTDNSRPSILRREATTNLLLREGDTVVVGGFTKSGDEFAKANAEHPVETFVFLTTRIMNRPPPPLSEADLACLESRQ